MVTEVRRPINDEKAADLGTAIDTAMVDIGDKFGLYEAISEAGPVTPAELAELTRIPWRHIRVWLSAQAAGDFLDYDDATGRYSLWCSWPRDPANAHSYRGDAVRRFVNLQQPANRIDERSQITAQTRLAFAGWAARQTGINRRLGYRAIPGTPVRSVWDVREQTYRPSATPAAWRQDPPSS